MKPDNGGDFDQSFGIVLTVEDGEFAGEEKEKDDTG